MNNEMKLDMFRRKQNIIALFLCAAGIIFNLLLSLIVSKLGLPIKIEMVGTVAVAVMGGYLPGVIVGFGTNMIKGLSDSSSFYYGVLNVLIALLAAYIARHGYLKSKLGIINTIIVFTLIDGGIGALIPFFLGNISYDDNSLSIILYETGFFNTYMSHFISCLILDLPDKAITVLLVLIILRIIPTKNYKYFRINTWMQNPDIEKDVTKEKTHIRVMSLQIKTLLVLVFSLTTVALVGTFISGRIYRKTLENERSKLAQGTAKLAANVVDGNRVDEYIRKKGNLRAYYETKNILKGILSSSSELKYLYVYVVEKEGFRVVYDIESDGVEVYKVGDLIPFKDNMTSFDKTLIAGGKVNQVITNDQYGYTLTAAEPVYNSYGECVCYAIADVDMELLRASERHFLVQMITIFLGFFILLCTFAIWMTDYHIIFPVKSITMQMDEFSYIDDSQEHYDEYVKKLRSLDIHTGDEIESLYRSICRMILSQAEQTRSIRQLSESTSIMQDGLIITMADMVENRDSDTGAHIQKTAAYVKIIVEGLKRKGYYAEKITPKFMSDVVRSAPLHDVGKINIPDVVLNKPGKLTDEEFEIMKTHTTAGKEIMDHVISTVEGENYLKEARNMAAYHHERWDGKGYPEGFHGETIPLSARIMAVADVFDALTSKRVYKPAFPLDKALAIIEEGKGTQFDPKCVEVFMESLDEIKDILEKYNDDANV